VQHARFVAADHEDGIGGSAVQKMKSAGWTLALKKETPDTVARQPGERVFNAFQGETKDFDQLFQSAGKITTQTKKPLTMVTKCIHPDRNLATIGPKDLVAFVTDLAALAVPGRVALKQHRQGSLHQDSIQR
jgi:hypothetical protein